MTRQDFLKLSWEQQKAQDFRKVFDPQADTDLVANCISHQDDTASMHIYPNAVYCYGCRRRWWPDQFLWDLGDRQLATERGSRKQPAPKYIPLAVADTYRVWLWGNSGAYSDRQGWLLKRGLTRETCNQNFIGHTGEAFSIPIFHTPETGGYAGVQSIRYRRDDELASDDRPKYWGTGGANQSLLYVPNGIADKSQYGVILCEGELDALRLVQEGYPAVSLTNGCNALKEEHLPKLAKIARKLGNRVTVCYDMDEPGRNAAAKVVDMLEAAKLWAHSLLWHSRFGKDVTEFLQNGQGLEYMLEQLWRSN